MEIELKQHNYDSEGALGTLLELYRMLGAITIRDCCPGMSIEIHIKTLDKNESHSERLHNSASSV